MPLEVRTTATLAEAASLLQSERAARFMAGGTLMMRAVNEGDVSFSTIVRTSDPAFVRVRAAGGRIELGAGVTMAQVLASRELAFLHPAARAVGGPAVRTMATVGGNLFAAHPYGDFATALLALDARVQLASGFGAREVPLEDLLRGRERGPRQLVAAVSFERPADPAAFRFRKMTRTHPKGPAVLTIAAWLPTSGGRVSGARVAFGAMAPFPIRARAVERALEGRLLSAEGVAPAVAAAAREGDPPTDPIASAWYRQRVVGVVLRRLLLGEL
ncbi:MAG: FAD binding domain-containing protein [Geminicoccaceae bacterium]|nr:FAD binding domain-containing protein [Geminicoccaceae bacterium]MCX8101393.1 FAD binding domain-containing protein [Geminicoccaceae bacterium]MDW8371025.1 FAD binding domain-containing protein [Geminicoccaceae bacterium]